MPVMSGEVYDALTEAGASHEKARKAAEAVAAYDNQFAEIRSDLANIRGEFRNEFTAIRGEFRNEFTNVRGEMAGMRGELSLLKWMIGFVLAGVLGLMLRIFIPT